MSNEIKTYRIRCVGCGCHMIVYPPTRPSGESQSREDVEMSKAAYIGLLESQISDLKKIRFCHSNLSRLAYSAAVFAFVSLGLYVVGSLASFAMNGSELLLWMCLLLAILAVTYLLRLPPPVRTSGYTPSIPHPPDGFLDYFGKPTPDQIERLKHDWQKANGVPKPPRGGTGECPPDRKVMVCDRCGYCMMRPAPPQPHNLAQGRNGPPPPPPKR